MFRNKVTLFNYDEQENIYYPTLLDEVELQPQYKTRFTSDSTKDLDSALLIVRYKINSDEKTEIGGKSFKKPKEWELLDATGKQTYFTFNLGRDFFVLGDFSSVTDVNYEIFKNENDEVFFVHAVKDFDDELKHWEVVGN